jgi:hypothetical protein
MRDNHVCQFLLNYVIMRDKYVMVNMVKLV